MNIKTLASCFFGLAISLCLCACAQSGATITSNKLNAYSGAPKRMLIFADLGNDLAHRANGDGTAVFEADFTGSLNNCGIVTEYHAKDWLTLQDERAAAIKSFSPDAILEIQWKTEQDMRDGQRTNYLAAIYDVKTQRLVWKADINLELRWFAGETLAAVVIDNLKKQAIIDSSCVTPKVPKV